jgi:hypothetical protein
MRVLPGKGHRIDGLAARSETLMFSLTLRHATVTEPCVASSVRFIGSTRLTRRWSGPPV